MERSQRFIIYNVFIPSRQVTSKNMSEPIENKWVSEGIVPRYASNGWSIHRHNKTSGKSRGGIIAKDMGEY